MAEGGKEISDEALFFVSLARRGKDAWNEWRKANPTISITFEGVHFDEPDKSDIDFSGFNFGDNARFVGCRFREFTFDDKHDFLDRRQATDSLPRARFAHAIFGEKANFSGAIFGDGADLAHAVFGDGADLSFTTFGAWTILEHVRFGDDANLKGATFGGATGFSSATFGHKAGFYCAVFGLGLRFNGTRFGDDAFFSGATFGYGARFQDTVFGNGADFSGATFDSNCRLSPATFEGALDLRARSPDEWQQQLTTLLAGSKTTQLWTPEWQEQYRNARVDWHERGASPSTLRTISFAGTRFGGVANFSGRAFLERCDLTDARFDQPPAFHDCEGLSQVDLYGSRIRFSGGRRKIAGWTTDSDVATRLRALRGVADETRNHDLERDLYIEERKAERGILFVRYLREGRTTWTRLVEQILWNTARLRSEERKVERDTLPHLLWDGLTSWMRLIVLVRDGLATATTERVVAGGKMMEITVVRITEAGRRVLEEWR